MRLEPTRVDLGRRRANQVKAFVGQYRLAVQEGRVLAKPDARAQRNTRNAGFLAHFAQRSLLKGFVELGTSARSKPTASDLRVLWICGHRILVSEQKHALEWIDDDHTRGPPDPSTTRLHRPCQGGSQIGMVAFHIP
jgi:hypothetical protein